MLIFLFHPMKCLWKQSEWRPRSPFCPCTVCYKGKPSSVGFKSGEQARHFMILPFLTTKTPFKYSVINLAACEGALSCMKTMFLRKANFHFFAMWWGAPSESGCRLWQSFWLHLQLWMSQPAHYQWLQPKHHTATPLLTPGPGRTWALLAVPASPPSIVSIEGRMTLIGEQNVFKTVPLPEMAKSCNGQPVLLIEML